MGGAKLPVDCHLYSVVNFTLGCKKFEDTRSTVTQVTGSECLFPQFDAWKLNVIITGIPSPRNLLCSAARFPASVCSACVLVNLVGWSMTLPLYHPLMTP